MKKNDLDSSNVLYDEDFEINEEEKVDESHGEVQYEDVAPASNLFENNDWIVSIIYHHPPFVSLIG